MWYYVSDTASIRPFLTVSATFEDTGTTYKVDGWEMSIARICEDDPGLCILLEPYITNDVHVPSGVFFDRRAEDPAVSDAFGIYAIISPLPRRPSSDELQHGPRHVSLANAELMRRMSIAAPNTV